MFGKSISNQRSGIEERNSILLFFFHSETDVTLKFCYCEIENHSLVTIDLNLDFYVRNDRNRLNENTSNASERAREEKERNCCKRIKLQRFGSTFQFQFPEWKKKKNFWKLKPVNKK